MSEPRILMPEYGKYGEDQEARLKKLATLGAHKDLSVIILTPALNDVPVRVVHSWMNLIRPPNQFSVFMSTQRMEVGKAYSAAIEAILATPELASKRYLLTLEHDNIPPPDGLVRLLERAEAHPEYAAIGGLYFTKGEDGVPQIWGNPREMPLNFKPQTPVPGELMECCGTGMGFTLYRLDLFKDERLRKPWFETKAEWNPSVGSRVFTQDLWFATDMRKYGYRCAVDCAVSVGHYDSRTDVVW